MSYTINIDMDGVVYDFNEAIRAVAEQELQRKLPESDRWSLWESWGISRDRFYDIFHKAILEYGVFSMGIPIDGAIEGVQALIRGGHRVRIVTAKALRYVDSTAAAQKQTIDFLAKHKLLNHVELAFTGNKQGYRADVVIDDKPTLAWAQPGAVNMLFDQPWNRLVEHDPALHGNVVRVYSWHHLVGVIEESLEVDTIADPGAGGL